MKIDLLHFLELPNPGKNRQEANGAFILLPFVIFFLDSNKLPKRCLGLCYLRPKKFANVKKIPEKKTVCFHFFQLTV